MKLSKEKTSILFINYYTIASEESEDTDQRVCNYLKNKVKRVVHIRHPFPDFGFRFSFLLIYEGGKKVKSMEIPVIRGPRILKYLHHILLTYYFIFKTGACFDLTIAAANILLIFLLPLRLFWVIKKLVYYSVDFVPQRFPNLFANRLYHFLDKLACKYSNANWVMVRTQIASRERYGITKINSAPFILVPIGYDTRKIKIKKAEKINLFNIVYAGGLRKETGVELAIKTLPFLIKKYPKIYLTIIGAGKDLNELKALSKQLKVDHHIEFLGYIKNFWDLTDILASKSIALAPYKPLPDSYSYFADPSKIKLYIACGLPVIATKVTTMTNLINKTGSGIIIDYSEKSLFEAITYLLSNIKKYKLYKNNAINLSSRFNIDHILNKAINKIPV